MAWLRGHPEEAEVIASLLTPRVVEGWCLVRPGVGPGVRVFVVLRVFPPMPKLRGCNIGVSTEEQRSAGSRGEEIGRAHV